MFYKIISIIALTGLFFVIVMLRSIAFTLVALTESIGTISNKYFLKLEKNDNK